MEVMPIFCFEGGGGGPMASFAQEILAVFAEQDFFWEKLLDKKSIKPGTMNIPEQPGTSRNIKQLW